MASNDLRLRTTSFRVLHRGIVGVDLRPGRRYSTIEHGVGLSVANGVHTSASS
jgi:hypothetical protein